MSRVLIGIGAVIVLAGAVFAIVNFSSGSRQQPALTPQNGWVPVVASAKSKPDPHVAGAFGAWRVVCRNITAGGRSQAKAPFINNLTPTSAPPESGRCAAALIMRRLGAPKEWLNLRLQTSATPDGAIAVLAYRTSERFIALPNQAPEAVDIRADKYLVTMWTQRCSRGICFAITDLTPSDLGSILSAHTLVIQLSQGKPTKANEVHLPTEGLRAAFAALQRQPA